MRLEAIRAADALSGRQDTHEAVCAERYREIIAGIGELKANLFSLAQKRDGDQKTADHQAWSMNWKAWAATGAIVLVLLTVIGWMSAQLYQMRPPQPPAAASDH